MKKILVALKFIEEPDDILKRALSVAKKYNALIYTLHVIHDMPRLSFYSDAYRLWEEFRDKAVKETMEQMSKFVKTLSHDFDKVEVLIGVGNAAEEIVKRAEDLDVDLVIVGKHQRSSVQHLMHHNVGEHVVRLSKKPVLCFNLP